MLTVSSISTQREVMDEKMLEADDKLAESIQRFEETCEKVDINPIGKDHNFEFAKGDLNAAVDNYIMTIKHTEGEIRNITKERGDLYKKLQKLEANLEKLRESALRSMKKANAKKYRGLTGSIILCRSVPRVYILNRESIPNEFKIEKIEYEIDRDSLKTYLENGNTVDGAELKAFPYIMIKKD